MLLLTLSIVLMLSIFGLALLAMTASAANVASGLSISTRTLHRIDGSFEQAVNELRNDDQATCTEGPQVYGDYSVECVSLVRPVDPDLPASRTMDLVATPPGGIDVSGRARIRVTDEINGQEIVGYSIEVCDWLLGSAASSEPLRGCSS